MDFLIRLWNKLVGNPVVDDKTLLDQELKRVEKLKEATRIRRERLEVRSQLMAARKESKELAGGLGKRGGRLMVYVAGLGGLLVIVIIMKSCVGC